MFETVSDFGLLTGDSRPLTIWTPIVALMPITTQTLHLLHCPLAFPTDLALSAQDFHVRVVARVMAWQTAPQKVGIKRQPATRVVSHRTINSFRGLNY